MEKLALYAGDGGASTLDDAVASVGDSAAMELDDAMLAAAEGDAAMLERALDRLFAEGESAVTVLRAAQRHVTRLHLAAARVDDGADEDDALRSLAPAAVFQDRRPDEAAAALLARRAAPAPRSSLLLDAEINSQAHRARRPRRSAATR